MRLVFVLATLILLTPRTAHTACTSINGTTLNFGTYTGLVLTNSTAQVQLQNCTANFAYSVGLNQGSTNGATVTTRQMSHPVRTA